MNKRIVIVLTLMAVMTALAATVMNAQQAPPSHDILADPAAFAERHIKALDEQVQLTDQQKARMRLIFTNEARRMQALLDDSSLPDSHKQMQMQQLHQDAFRKVSGVLTPEQRMHMAHRQGKSPEDASPQEDK